MLSKQETIEFNKIWVPSLMEQIRNYKGSEKETVIKQLQERGSLPANYQDYL